MRTTIILDPKDCGVRESKHVWHDAAYAFRIHGDKEFPRVSREREAELVELAGDMFPQSPGEVSVIDLADTQHESLRGIH